MKRIIATAIVTFAFLGHIRGQYGTPCDSICNDILSSLTSTLHEKDFDFEIIDHDVNKLLVDFWGGVIVYDLKLCNCNKSGTIKVLKEGGPVYLEYFFSVCQDKDAISAIAKKLKTKNCQPEIINEYKMTWLCCGMVKGDVLLLIRSGLYVFDNEVITILCEVLDRIKK